ncbi:mechanosensitive ion channel family protein [Lishizhenia sp.]|uniref:mechanosensitive ion channel family protein n=1 Tax=Lishizhenia sp. TaxID=2497594 RepID=UPI00299F36FA|nr:mechanosensitive ion channel domain-containing protein [Lishizhenia sp.]MDX1446211.1 mechanosensitive ion channel [Lishizhenia sp.]
MSEAQNLFDEYLPLVISWGIQIITALVILVVGLWLTKFITKKADSLMGKRDVDAGLRTFIRSLINILLKLLVFITAITQLGFEMTSFVAILGAAGLAVGMAFSGTLSNFAGGVMILVFKPYKVGDFIEAQGVSGTVQEIQIFNTILTKLDNRTIFLPNGPTASGTITNLTRNEVRRVDFSFGIAYGESYPLAVETIKNVVATCDKVIDEPAPFYGLGELADSSVNITVRLWCKTPDYWDVYFYMNEKIYEAFENTEGLSIPFPQMDVHMDKVN